MRIAFAVSSRQVTNAVAIVLFAATPGTVFSQWSHDPAINFGISTRGSDQNQVKILPTADGGCYMTWLDGIGTGWDTRLQRLNSRGVKQLGPNGVLVADTAFSSTEDYGFAVDASGNAVIAYRDNSSGTTHVEVQKVDAAGNLLWNAAGVQVSTAASNSPRVCVTTDGSVIVGWTQSGVVRLQRLDSNGAPQWAAGGVTDTVTTGVSYGLSDLVAADSGGAIALYINYMSNPIVTGNKLLRAQRFSAAGTKDWNGGSVVSVFDANSIQNGTFPSLTSDGSGGAIASWYEIGGSRNAYVQQLTAAGAEVFPHNGLAICTDIAGRMRISSSVSRDAATGDLYCAMLESNTPTQGAYSIRAQRLDAAGNRLWTSTGIEITPQTSNQPGSISVQAASTGNGAIVSWYNGGFGNQTVYSSRLSINGSFAWSPTIRDVSIAPSGKARLWSLMNTAGSRLVLAWADTRTDSNDIFAQLVNLDGSLGNPGDVNDDGVVNVADLLAVISGWGACPAPPVFCAPDLTPAPIGDGQVNVADLLAVIANWG